MTHKFEVASDAWLAAMAATIDEVLSDYRSDDAVITIAEEFYDLPSHLPSPPGQNYWWYMRIDRGHVEVRRGRPDHADLYLTYKYEFAASLGRTAFDETQEGRCKRRALMLAAMQDGRLRIIGNINALPAALASRLDRVHNTMAASTI